MRVENMSVNGREIANQFLIEAEEGTYFQSYDSIIAFIPYGLGSVQLDKNKYDYNNTTVKYRNMFLGCSSEEVERRIEEGRYKLVELNGGREYE